LTALFESVAMIVDQHQPVVEKYYGSGKMASVIERLLDECDRVVKKLVDGWEEERSMKRKLANVSSSTFSTSSSSSPTIRRQVSQLNAPDDDIVDPREIDKVLSELAGMTGRWSLFKKFLTERLRDDYLDSDDDRVGPATLHTQRRSLPSSASCEKQSSDPSTSPVFESKETLLIESTACHRLFEDVLTTYYLPLELWYTRTIIDKAHRLSQQDISQSHATTTTPDDVFYILKIVLARMISTGSTSALKRTTELLRDVIDRDFTGIIKKKLDDVYRSAGNAGVATRGEKAERDNRNLFLILLNDLDISSSHMERLIKDLISHPSISQHYTENECDSVKDTISSLSGLVTKFRSTLRAGIEQLFNQLMRPKLRTLIVDVYKDVSYILDDDSYSAAEYQDVVRKRFIKSWESLADGYKRATIASSSAWHLMFCFALGKSLLWVSNFPN